MKATTYLTVALCLASSACNVAVAQDPSPSVPDAEIVPTRSTKDESQPRSASVSRTPIPASTVARNSTATVTTLPTGNVTSSIQPPLIATPIRNPAASNRPAPPVSPLPKDFSSALANARNIGLGLVAVVAAVLALA